MYTTCLHTCFTYDLHYCNTVLRWNRGRFEGKGTNDREEYASVTLIDAGVVVSASPPSPRRLVVGHGYSSPKTRESQSLLRMRTNASSNRRWVDDNAASDRRGIDASSTSNWGGWLDGGASPDGRWIHTCSAANGSRGLNGSASSNGRVNASSPSNRRGVDDDPAPNRWLHGCAASNRWWVDSNWRPSDDSTSSDRWVNLRGESRDLGDSYKRNEQRNKELHLDSVYSGRFDYDGAVEPSKKRTQVSI